MITKQTTLKNNNGQTVSLMQTDREITYLISNFGDMKTFTGLTFDEVEAAFYMQGFDGGE